MESGHAVEVDVIDRLPAPYGLVRYGVAPDHVRMKRVISVLRSPFVDGSGVRFLGNVTVGSGGLSPAVLAQHYHAVIYASGCPRDRRLDVPAESVEGSYGSRAFVGWYSGHPDFIGLSPRLDHRAAVVIGAGNVALDIARVLTRKPAEMAATDIPDEVLDALRSSAVRDVHIVIRRGAQHVRFTPAELRQIAGLDDVSVVIHNDSPGQLGIATPHDRRQEQVAALLDKWATTQGEGLVASRRIHFHFLRSPVRYLEKDGHICGVVVERNEIRDGRLLGTGEEEVIAAGLVVGAIGYTGEPLAGLPFDTAQGIVPNHEGRVLRDGVVVPGAYVTGWLKRGPSGVIGTNKEDAAETVEHLLDDLDDLPDPALPQPSSLTDRLSTSGMDPVEWDDWQRLDAEELRLGAVRGGTERVKVPHLASMIAICKNAGQALAL